MIIDRYVLRELGLPFAAVSGVLLAVFITFTLSRLLADAGAGLLNAAEVSQLVLLKSLIALEVLLPIALYVAVIVGIGRLYRESETHAMGAGGIGPLRLLRPVLFCSVMLALLVSALSIELRPRAWTKIYELKNEAEASSDIDRVKAGEFHEYGKQARTLFIDSMSKDRSELHGIFIHESDAGHLQIIAAPSAGFTEYVTPDLHELRLRNARVYRTVEGRPSFSGHFGSFVVSLRAVREKKLLYKEKSKPTDVLFDTQNPSGRAELQWRFTTPLSTLLLALAAVPLSEASPRQPKHTRLAIALLLYAFYYNLLGIARNWVEQGTLQTLWWAPTLLCMAVIALHAYPHLRRIFPRRGLRA